MILTPSSLHAFSNSTMSPFASLSLCSPSIIGAGPLLLSKGCNGRRCLCRRRVQRHAGVAGGEVGDNIVRDSKISKYKGLLLKVSSY